MLNSWLKTHDVMECCLVVSVLCFGTQNHFDGESSLPSICFCCVSSHCFSWCTSTLQAVSSNALSGSSNGFQSTGVSATTGSQIIGILQRRSSLTGRNSSGSRSTRSLNCRTNSVSLGRPTFYAVQSKLDRRTSPTEAECYELVSSRSHVGFL